MSVKILISAMVLHCVVVRGADGAKRIQPLRQPLRRRFPWLWHPLIPLLIITILIMLRGLFPSPLLHFMRWGLGSSKIAESADKFSVSFLSTDPDLQILVCCLLPNCVLFLHEA